MKTPAAIAPIIARADAQWRKLSPAGQRAITVVGILLVFGLGWALVYQPLQASQHRDRTRIATLTEQLSRMQAQAQEVAQIRTTAPVAATGATSIADVAGLQSIFGPTAAVALQSKPGGIAFAATVAAQPYAVVIDRLEQATARYRIRIASMTLTRNAPASSAVSGEIVLVDAR
jgi:type II secretory pathway component PulM